MLIGAIIGINCDGYCNPRTYSTGIRHWLGWTPSGSYHAGPAERNGPDHADCAKLATAAVLGVTLAIPDNARAETIAAQIRAYRSDLAVATSYAPIASLIPDATADRCYNCWPADVETYNLPACHNNGMGTVLIYAPDSPPQGDTAMSSQEYQTLTAQIAANKHQADARAVEIAYMTVLGRTVEPGAFAGTPSLMDGWINWINTQSWESFIAMLANTPEGQNFAKTGVADVAGHPGSIAIPRPGSTR
jgi:hypothetical protein